MHSIIILFSHLSFFAFVFPATRGSAHGITDDYDDGDKDTPELKGSLTAASSTTSSPVASQAKAIKSPAKDSDMEEDDDEDNNRNISGSKDVDRSPGGRGAGHLEDSYDSVADAKISSNHTTSEKEAVYSK